VARQRRLARAGLEELIEVMNQVQVLQVIRKEKDEESFHDVRPHHSRRPHGSTRDPDAVLIPGDAVDPGKR
jgi:hypothetical protein